MLLESTYSAAEIEELIETLSLFLFFTVISIATLWIARRSGFFRLSDYTSFKPSISGWDVLRGFVFFILTEMVLVPALLIVVLTWKDPTFQKDQSAVAVNRALHGLLNFWIAVGGTLGVLGAFFSFSSYQRRQILGDPTLKWHNLGVGMTTWFISYPLATAVGQFVLSILLLLKRTPVDQVAVRSLKEIKEDPFVLLLTLVLVIFCVPIAEEILFRGLLQSWLKKKIVKTKWVIACTSLVFALFHYSSQQGITNIGLLSSLFLLSCFLGFLYEKQRSLWAPIGLHATYNAISALMIVQG